MSSAPLQLRQLLERLIEAEIHFATDLGDVDVLQGLPQVPRFDALNATATEVDMDGLLVRVCSLDLLLEMKRASDRPRDREDLDALEATQGEGQQGG